MTRTGWTALDVDRPADTLEPAIATRASVILVSHNGRSDLHCCLATLLESRDPDVEVIVVDNASGDGTADCVAAAFPTVRLIRSPVNVGFGAACNLAAGNARGQYLAFLNPDTVVEPGWLDALIEAIEETPDAGLATSRILLLDAPEQLNAAGNATHFTGLTLCRGAGRPRWCFAEREDVGAVSGAAFVARHRVFQELGGFDESFFLYLDDTDLSWRARLAGYRCLYVPSSVVYHRYELRFGPEKTFFLERNRYRMIIKSLRWRTLLILVPALVLAECVAWGFGLLADRGRLTNKLRAYRWVVMHWPEVLDTRRRTQALRRRTDRALIAGCESTIDFATAYPSIAAAIADRCLNPLFRGLHRLALALIDW